ncbi:hypothetical protein BDK51DRAFT_33678, partial [Blyttiomyces helicus]
GTTKSGAAGMDKPEYFLASLDATGGSVNVNGLSAEHHHDFMQSDTATKLLGNMRASGELVSNSDEGEVAYGADKESEVKQDDHKKQAQASGEEDAILDEEEDDNDDDTPLVRIKPSSTAARPTFGPDGYWNEAATKNTTMAIAAAKRKAMQNAASDDPYKRDPRSKKPRADAEGKHKPVEKDIEVPGQRVPKGKTSTKKTDWAEIAATKVDTKARVEIE